MVWQFKWTLFDRALTVRFLCCIQLFWERLSEKNVHATIPKGNMGYDQYTVPNDCSCQTYFCCFPLALENICPWPACHSFKFLWRTVHSKPPPIPFGIVAYTFSDNLSRNSCKQVLAFESVDEIVRCDHSNETSFQQSFHKVPPFITLCIYRGLSVLPNLPLRLEYLRVRWFNTQSGLYLSLSLLYCVRSFVHHNRSKR